MGEMSQLDEVTRKTVEHVRLLSETIGGRGSCTAAERQAAEVASRQMQRLGVCDVRLVPYSGAPSTYVRSLAWSLVTMAKGLTGEEACRSGG